MRNVILHHCYSTCVLFSVLVWQGCGRSHSEQTHHAPAPSVTSSANASNAPVSNEFEFVDSSKKRWWLEKTFRLLKNGQGLLDEGTREELMTKKPQEVVQELVDNDAFYDTMVDFSLFYLGLKSDRIKFPKKGDVGLVTTTVIDRPQAIDGALRIKNGGDYFDMFTADVQEFAPPMPDLIDLQSFLVREDSKSYRVQAYAKVLAKLDKLIVDLQANRTPTMNEFCTFDNGGSVFAISFDLGLPKAVASSMTSPGSPFSVFFSCYQNPFLIPNGALEKLQQARAEFTDEVEYLLTLEPDNYMPTSLMALRPLDTKRLHLSDKNPDGSDRRGTNGLEWFWASMNNASTNYNRKRASYVLKRFFCDDLTPVNVLAPANHAGADRHAADPACQACHYKLDPMAGFFRYNGATGVDFRKKEEIVFDDQARKKLSEYVDSWQGDRDGDKGHAWAVGYIRSTTADELNDYTDHPEDPILSDLLTVMKRAPEVKQCLVKRLFEYFVGENQAVDAAYLEELTNRFAVQYASNTTAAFKETVKSLVLSTTFRTPDPVSEECYDYAEGQRASDRPPCKIAYVLQKNCAGCHQGASAAGRLDLTRWVQSPGNVMGFPHKDLKTGEQLSRGESFKRIVNRLASTDPDLRMPLNQFITVTDRDVLFLWLNGALSSAPSVEVK